MERQQQRERLAAAFAKEAVRLHASPASDWCWMSKVERQSYLQRAVDAADDLVIETWAAGLPSGMEPRC